MDLITMGARQQLDFANQPLFQFHHSLILPGEEKTLLSFQHKLLSTLFWKRT